MYENWDTNNFVTQQAAPQFENMGYEMETQYHDDYRSQGRSYGGSSNRLNDDQNYGRKRTNYDDGKPNGMKIHIGTEKVGKLMGKRGTQIRELQDQSNARIYIDRANRSDTTMVTLVGSEDAQLKAKSLIEELLYDEPSNRQRMDTQSQAQTGLSQQVTEPPPAQTDYMNIDWNKAREEYEKHQQEKWSKLPPIVKYFYKEDPVVANMSKEQVEHIRKSNNDIQVQVAFEDESSADKVKIPNPVETFEQAFADYPDILREIRKQGFEKPSPIQCQAWPILLSGKDMIGIAQTGTGKTLAFLLPALIHIDGQPTPRSERTGPNVLILAPTRELALQIEKETSKYSYHGIRAVCVYGGGSRKDQIQAVEKGVQIVIATPGRLNDLVQANVLDVAAVTYLILDEADRMLDMGFEPQIRKSLLNIRPDRQTVMTSATWPQGVRRLAKSYMKDPIQVFVGSLDLAAVHSVTQKIYLVDEEEKTEMLQEFINAMGPNDKVMVFFGKKAKVDDVASDLALAGVDCQSIHGGREQCDREQALEELKTGHVRILLATDVASRGIDIEDVTHVFNFDFPHDIEEYVHRVGRTGRAGRSGESITLMTRKDWSHARELIKILEEASQEVPEELYKMSERYDAWKEKKDRERSDARGGFRRSRYGNAY